MYALPESEPETEVLMWFSAVACASFRHPRRVQGRSTNTADLLDARIGDGAAYLEEELRRRDGEISEDNERMAIWSSMFLCEPLLNACE